MVIPFTTVAYHAPNHNLPDDPSEMTDRLDSALDAMLKIGEIFSESEIAQVDEDVDCPI